ncbi:MAG: tRNA cyclic N6-threonylcarbamoyladenosine(37) synthase TcdA [Thiohalobacterales bacterium]
MQSRHTNHMNPPDPQPAASTTDTDRRFGGITRLYGETALGNFQRAHVCVIGIGGVGSWAVEALARSAIGQITLVDLDHVAESNINRQLHALDDTLGAAKVAVMAERIHQINPACRVNTIEEHLGLDNLGELLDRNYDYVIDCVDDFRIKAALIAWCRRNRIRLVTVGGAGGQTSPAQVMTADLSNTEHDALFARTRKLLRQEYGFPKNLKRRFDIPCIYSREQPVFPAEDGSVCHEKPGTTNIGGLNCAGNLGSVMTVTASFGLHAVAHVLGKLQ